MLREWIEHGVDLGLAQKSRVLCPLNYLKHPVRFIAYVAYKQGRSCDEMTLVHSSNGIYNSFKIYDKFEAV